VYVPIGGNVCVPVKFTAPPVERDTVLPEEFSNTISQFVKSIAVEIVGAVGALVQR